MKTVIIIAIILIIVFAGIGILYYVNNPVEVPTPAGPGSCIELGCPAGTIYAGSINSDKYYECDCRWAQNVLPENLVCFESDEQALADQRTKSEC